MALPSEDVEAGMEPIAIVGMAMRFPGGAHSSQEFWEMLKEGRDGWAPIPKHRYNIDGYYHPDNARAGSVGFSLNLVGSHDTDLSADMAQRVPLSCWGLREERTGV
jgi:hypothetical protein